MLTGKTHYFDLAMSNSYTKLLEGTILKTSDWEIPEKSPAMAPPEPKSITGLPREAATREATNGQSVREICWVRPLKQHSKSIQS